MNHQDIVKDVVNNLVNDVLQNVQNVQKYKEPAYKFIPKIVSNTNYYLYKVMISPFVLTSKLMNIPYYWSSNCN